ncbi:triacylglycerol lipase, partial [Alloscardovia theropitheci]
MTRTFTEHERQKIAELEYKDYTELDAKRHADITFSMGNHQRHLGTLDQVVDDKSTGLKMYVVKTDDKHYTVLYQGSTDFNKEGGKQDWLENDAPMAGAILSKTKMATPQLKKAASVLQEVMDKHKGASFDVYGHSLGSMCAQYAIT